MEGGSLMELATIEMEVPEAQDAYREYRRAVTASAHEKLGKARREYERLDRAVMRGYRELAKGRSLLELSKAMETGGTVTVGAQDWNGTEIEREMPALAVCRADARRCFCNGVNSNGGAVFHADDRWSVSRKNNVRVLDGTFGEQTGRAEWFSAIVPTIPPQLRPEHKLSGYHILWEAEWTGSTPADPALLKHLGVDLYVVLAVWDLTELERAALGGIDA
jgi:hypothetical protein